MKVRAGGIEISYELSGQGAPLVLIHGFTDNLRMWFDQVPAFAGRFEVLSYDVRGHGETETPAGSFSMDLFVADLRALLAALEIEKACLLGYSMGGRIALQFALEHPESTAGLVFANSGVRGAGTNLTEEQVAELLERRRQMAEMLGTGDIEVIADGMAERSFSPGLRERDPVLFRKYKEIKLRNDPRHYPAILEALVQAMASPPDLSALRSPALIIAGDRDSFMAVEEARAMEKAIADSTVVILPTGHAAAIEAPEAFNRAVLDFMSRVEPVLSAHLG
jgi:pimeloyl-ACP methyl ester carboxylesterase